MKINEIFLSIQGESTHAGRPCLFIRTTGCNLRCTYCDTEYAFYDGKDMTIPELIDIVQKSGVNLVEITGGEPLMQDDLPQLVNKLLNDNYEVLVETGGSIDISKISEDAIKILDLKCPSSGMMDRNKYENLIKLGEKDEVKFVIETREDYDWAVEIIEKYKLDEKLPVLFSPVFDKLKPIKLAEWILKDKLKIRMQLQLHKYIWEPHMHGV